MAVVSAEEEKAASAEIAGCGMDDGEGKARGYSGVDGVAAGAERLKAGVRGEMVDADDHAVAGSDGLLVQIGNHDLRALLDLVLGGNGDSDGEGGSGEGGEGGKIGPSSHGVVTG